MKRPPRRQTAICPCPGLSGHAFLGTRPARPGLARPGTGCPGNTLPSASLSWRCQFWIPLSWCRPSWLRPSWRHHSWPRLSQRLDLDGRCIVSDSADGHPAAGCRVASCLAASRPAVSRPAAFPPNVGRFFSGVTPHVADSSVRAVGAWPSEGRGKVHGL